MADFLIKSAVSRDIPLMGTQEFFYPYGGIPGFRNFLGIEFSIVYAFNTGAAWGIFSEYKDLLLVARVLLLGALVAFAFFYNDNPQYRLPFALIIAGALGNIVDYFLYGHVIDMFRFVFWGYDYPVFNLADASIFIGIFWLVLFTSPQRDAE